MDFEDFNGRGEDKDARETPDDRNWRSFKFFIIGLLSAVFVFIATSAAFPGIYARVGGVAPAAGLDAEGAVDTESVAAKLNKIYRVLDDYYVNEYDRRETVEGLYSGMVSGVGDPYTVYFDSEHYARFKEDTSGTYAGIGLGVNIDKTSNAIVVVSPFDGAPAAEAGVQTGDWIIKVNEQDVTGEILDIAVSMMKGEPGTTVDLTLYRPSEKKEIEMTLTRKKIDVPTVSAAWLADGVAYIRISQFDRVTYDQFAEQYRAMEPTMKGLILDLRNNPGGLLNVVTDITDMLVPEGTIVYQENKKGEKQYSNSKPDHISVPLLVLVNGGSASASEVLSGAVQDMGVGELVGAQTFGKGVVQNIIELGDGSAVKVTIAKYYTPNGRCIQDIGLTPDYPAEIGDGEIAKVVDGAIDPANDPQLLEAISVMNKKI
ncbi:MAG: S41 family peptidase [Clostridiales bacterium]|jgi:carboxyl-terminal processing protease|nr:S41 family peptidase [Clostridiales bacterium]